MSSFREYSQSRDRTQVSRTADGSLLSEPTGKPMNTGGDALSLLQGNLPTQELNQVSCIAGGFFTPEPQGKPITTIWPSYSTPELLYLSEKDVTEKKEENSSFFLKWESLSLDLNNPDLPGDYHLFSSV